MEHFGLPRGKQVGRLKALAFEGQQRGAFADVATGLAWLAEQAPDGQVPDPDTPSTKGTTEG